MKDSAITEVHNFIEHLIATAQYVKSNDEELGYTSVRDRLRQTWEISFDTYGLKWGTEDEDTYGELFDSIQDKLSEILG